MGKDLNKLIIEALKDVLVSEVKEADTREHNTQFHYGTLTLEFENALTKVNECIPFIDAIMSAFESIHNGECESFVFMREFEKALSGRALEQPIREAAMKVLSKLINSKGYKKVLSKLINSKGYKDEHGYHKDIDEIADMTRNADSRKPGKDEANIGPDKLRPTPKVDNLKVETNLKKNLIEGFDEDLTGKLDKSASKSIEDSQKLDDIKAKIVELSRLNDDIKTKLSTNPGVDEFEKLQKLLQANENEISELESNIGDEPSAGASYRQSGICKICKEMKKSDKSVDPKGVTIDSVMYCPTWSDEGVYEAEQFIPDKKLTLEDIADPCDKHTRAILGWEPADKEKFDPSKDFDPIEKVYKVPVRPICRDCHLKTFGEMIDDNGSAVWKSVREVSHKVGGVEEKKLEYLAPLIVKYNKPFEPGYRLFIGMNKPGPTGSVAGTSSQLSDRAKQERHASQSIHSGGRVKHERIKASEFAAKYSKLGYDDHTSPKYKGSLATQYTVVDDEATIANLMEAASRRLIGVNDKIKDVTASFNAKKTQCEDLSKQLASDEAEVDRLVNLVKRSPEYNGLRNTLKKLKNDYLVYLKSNTDYSQVKSEILKLVPSYEAFRVMKSKLPQDLTNRQLVTSKMMGLIRKKKEIANSPKIKELKTSIELLRQKLDSHIEEHPDVADLLTITRDNRKIIDRGRAELDADKITVVSLVSMRDRLRSFIRSKHTNVKVGGDKILYTKENEYKGKILCDCTKCGRPRMVDEHAINVGTEKVAINPDRAYDLSAGAGFAPGWNPELERIDKLSGKSTRPMIKDIKPPIVRTVSGHVTCIALKADGVCGGEMIPRVGCGAMWFTGEKDCPSCGRVGKVKHINVQNTPLDAADESQSMDRPLYKCERGHIFQDAWTNEGDMPQLIKTGAKSFFEKVPSPKYKIRRGSGPSGDIFSILNDDGLELGSFNSKAEAIDGLRKLDRGGVRRIEGGKPETIKPETHRCKTCGLEGVITPYKRAFNAFFDYDMPVSGRMTYAQERVKGSRLKRAPGKWGMGDATHFYVCPNYIETGRLIESLSEIWLGMNDADDKDQVYSYIDGLRQLQRMHRWDVNGTLAVDTVEPAFSGWKGPARTPIYSPCEKWHPRTKDCQKCKWMDVPVVQEGTAMASAYREAGPGSISEPKFNVSGADMSGIPGIEPVSYTSVPSTHDPSIWSTTFTASNEINKIAREIFDNPARIGEFNRLAAAMLAGDSDWKIRVENYLKNHVDSIVQDVLDSDPNLINSVIKRLSFISEKVKHTENAPKPGFSMPRRGFRAVTKEVGVYKQNYNGVNYKLIVVPRSAVRLDSSDYDKDDDMCSCDHLGSVHEDGGCRVCECVGFKSRAAIEFSGYLNSNDINYEIALPVTESGEELIKNYFSTIYGVLPNNDFIDKKFNEMPKFYKEDEFADSGDMAGFPEEVQNLLRIVDNLMETVNKVASDKVGYRSLAMKRVCEQLKSDYNVIKSELDDLRNEDVRNYDFSDIISLLRELIGKIEGNLLELGPQWAKQELFKDVISEIKRLIGEIRDGERKKYYIQLSQTSINDYEKLVEIMEALAGGETSITQDQNVIKKSESDVGQFISDNPVLELESTYGPVNKARLQIDTDNIVAKHGKIVANLERELGGLADGTIQHDKKLNELLREKKVSQANVIRDLHDLKNKYEIDFLIGLILDRVSKIGNEWLEAKFDREVRVIADSSKSDVVVITNLRKLYENVKEYSMDKSTHDMSPKYEKALRDEATKIIRNYWVPLAQKSELNELNSVTSLKELAQYVIDLYNEPEVIEATNPPTISLEIQNIIKKILKA